MRNCKKNLRKVLSVFLATLIIISIFSLDFAYAAEVAGVGNPITSPSSSATYYQILDSGLGTDFYVVGYRFSVVNNAGETIRKGSQNQYCTIDIMRYGDYGTAKFGSSSNHWNRKATTTDVLKMKRQWNKYQILASYTDGTYDVERVARNMSNNSSLNTYGIWYGYSDKKTDGKSKNNTKPSSNYVTLERILPDTTGIKSWAEVAGNRAAILNKVGFSGTTSSNVDAVLGSNRILIEPLYVVKWAGQYTLASAADLAILNYAFEKAGKYYFTTANDKKGQSAIYGQIFDGKVSTIRYYTNRNFQESLYADKNLDMPRYGNLSPLTVQRTLKPEVPRNSSGAIASDGWTNVGKYCWSYNEILHSTLGMAISREEHFLTFFKSFLKTLLWEFFGMTNKIIGCIILL